VAVETLGISAIRAVRRLLLRFRHAAILTVLPACQDLERRVLRQETPL
jgi:hypothetical protein